MGVVSQGEVYWMDFGEPAGSEPGYNRPVVVIQSDTLNESAIKTVLVCPVTSNLRRGAWGGNVTLAQGDAGLPKASVVEVTGTYAVNKSELAELSGRLGRRTVQRVIDGLNRAIEIVS